MNETYLLCNDKTKHEQKLNYGRAIKNAAQNLYPMFRMKGEPEVADTIKNCIDCFNQRWKSKYSSEQMTKQNLGRYLRAPRKPPHRQ